MRSPFAGMRSALLEIKNLRANAFKLFSVCAIALIPLVYAGLFLSAFLDPYGSLDKVPAVVVNLDEGATLDGEERNVGQELCDSLIENNQKGEEGEATGYDWQFVESVEQADKGLRDGDYYMELIIPADFSASLASVETDDPHRAELEVYFNPSTNLIAQTVGSSMVTKIRAELNEDIGANYLEAVFVNVSEASDQMLDAVNASEELADGLATAHDGGNTLTLGLGSLATGAGQLAQGTDELAQGTSSLPSNEQAQQAVAGSQGILSGLQGLETGLGGLSNGISALKQAMGPANDASAQTINGALNQLAGGAAQIGDGLGAMAGQVGSSADSSTTLCGAASQLANAAGALQETLSSESSCYEAAIAAYKAGDTETGDYYAELARQSAAGASQYAAGIESGASTLYGGAIALSSGLNELEGAVEGLSLGIAGVKGAIGAETDTGATVWGALNQLGAAVGSESSPNSLLGGASALSQGFDAYSSQVNPLILAAPQLREAIASVAQGASQVADGTQQLASGAGALAQGIGTAADGAEQLHEGLADGQESMAESVTNADARAEVMNDPVAVNGKNQTGESITVVPNYGTGFAPYFIGLGMWVGCLMITFLVRSMNNRLLMSSSSSVSAVVSSYIPMALVAVIQVVALLVFVQFVLGFPVSHPLHYYLFGIVTALAFIAIIQFFRATFGTSGTVVVVVLLMLQLCTAAGTFPIQTELPVFNALNPLLPMTYVVQGFRMAMCGLSASYVIVPMLVLVGFLVAFLALSTLVAHRRRRVSMDTLYPKIQMVG